MNQDKLNVLFLPKWYPNKFDEFDGNFIKNYAHAVQLYCNVSVLFVHSDNNLSANYKLSEQNNKGIRELSIYFKKPSSPFPILNKFITAIRYRKAQFIGYRKLKDETFDLCHIHILTRSSFLALRLKNKFDIPFIISEHWSGYHKHVNGYRGILKKLFTRKVVKNATAVHTVSTALKEAMLLHQLKNTYTVIPNVVDTNLFHPVTKQNNKTEILFIGNLLQQPKRILDIIRLFPRVIEQNPNINLSIYGEGKDEEKCKKLIQELNLESFIQLKGVRKRAEIAKVISYSDFLILFSEYENQPCVINEALSCGIPVVVPDIAGIKELMNSDLGIVFPLGNQEAFIEAVNQMVKRHTAYNSDTIRQFAVETFSENVIGSKFNILYQKIINHG